MSLETQTAVLGYLIYGGAAGLIIIGLYAMVTRRHLIRILLGLTLMEAGVNLSLVAAGFRPDAVAPIFSGTATAGIAMMDPVPQALILTAIVIGVAILALALAMTVRVQQAYATLDTRQLAERLATEQTALTTPPQQAESQREDTGKPLPSGGTS